MVAATLPCEQIARHPDFRRLDQIDGVDIDLRYIGPNNFVGRDLYGRLDCAWLHYEADHALRHAVAWLRAHYPGWRIRVFDAMRPHRVQEMLWHHLDGTNLHMYVADPARGSIHSFGMAIDATLLDAEGRELDMGTGFDEMNERSHPALEARFLDAGALSEAQVGNRRILRAAMHHGGFQGISSEWWHFNYGDPAEVRARYLRID